MQCLIISHSAWSDEGCQIQKTNETHTICECNHLTNFAVLMDVHAVRLDIAHQVALQIITYIGCIISVVCLVLAILTFQLFRGLKVMHITARAPIDRGEMEFFVIFPDPPFAVGQNDNPQESLRVPADS